jgi:hypothetical protein
MFNHRAYYHRTRPGWGSREAHLTHLAAMWGAGPANC